jgi:hypothetical protein
VITLSEQIKLELKTTLTDYFRRFNEVRSIGVYGRGGMTPVRYDAEGE